MCFIMQCDSFLPRMQWKIISTILSAILLCQLSLCQGQYETENRKRNFFGLPDDIKPARSFRDSLEQRQYMTRYFGPTPSVVQTSYDARIQTNSIATRNSYPSVNGYDGSPVTLTRPTVPAYTVRPPATGVPIVPIQRPQTEKPPTKVLFALFTAGPYQAPKQPTYRHYLPPPTFPPTVRLPPGQTRPPAKGVPPFTPAPWASTTAQPPKKVPPGGPYGNPTVTRLPPRSEQYIPVTPGPPGFVPPDAYVPPNEPPPYNPPNLPPYFPPREPQQPPYPVPPPGYQTPGTPAPPATFPPVEVPPPSPPQPTRKASPPPQPPSVPPPTRAPPLRVTTEPPQGRISTPLTPRTTTTTKRFTPSTRRPMSATPRKPGVSPPSKLVPNRMRGKAHVICEPDGIVFTATTFLSFYGEVFARDRTNSSKCFHQFMGESTTINVTFPYKECGTPIPGARSFESMYQVEIVISYVQNDGSITVQSFLARCESQRIRYATEDVPRQIEEALEELNLIPIKIEKKAEVPDCRMRIVLETEHDHHSYGPSNNSEISDTHIGQQLRIEWSLNPPSTAYGFIIKNCTVNDKISGREYLVIDEKGCSTDLNILGHPHYDTYHDLAIVHWHAFKVPDDSTLSIDCHFHMCSEIEDDNGRTSCGDIPTPPFCPNIVTAPPNSLLFEFESNYLARRFKEDPLDVGAEFCVVDENNSPEQCLAEKETRTQLSKTTQMTGRHRLLNKDESHRIVCMSRLLFTVLLFLSILGFLISLGIFMACYFSGTRVKNSPRFPKFRSRRSRVLASSSISGSKTFRGSVGPLGSSEVSCAQNLRRNGEIYHPGLK